MLEGLPYHGLVRNHADLEFPIAIQHQHAHRRGIHRRHRDAALESHESANLDFTVDRRKSASIACHAPAYSETPLGMPCLNAENSRSSNALADARCRCQPCDLGYFWEQRLDRLQRELWTVALRILFVILLVVNGYMSLHFMHLLH